MGVESYLLADSLVGVIAQRLVRRLCTACRRQRPATEDEKLILGVPADKEYLIYDSVGCSLCGETGYYGRIGVYEIMEISPKLRHAISTKGSTELVKETALAEGMHTLHMSAAEYVLEGITTISEMVKISFEE
jgi:type IV pilus assembly protein PilB